MSRPAFDDWAVLPGQGLYHNPTFIFPTENGSEKRPVKGYVTDLITDKSLDFLRARDRERPFFLMCHHKAPHRHWEPDEKHADMYLNEDIPEPETLYDDYANRAAAAEAAEMRMGVHHTPLDLKTEIQHDLPEMELRKWAYQRYIKDYCAWWPALTTMSAACSITWTPRGWPKTPWSSTHRIRVSSWAITAGTTSVSCTKNRCECPTSCAIRAASPPGASTRT